MPAFQNCPSGSAVPAFRLLNAAFFEELFLRFQRGLCSSGLKRRVVRACLASVGAVATEIAQRERRARDLGLLLPAGSEGRGVKGREESSFEFGMKCSS